MAWKDKENEAYLRYIHSTAWHKKALKRREMDGDKCQVCGRPADEVHHLTYERIGHEDMDDIVSLCKECHKKAEAIYDPRVIPWAMDAKRAEIGNFMAAMKVDASAVAPVVFEYLKVVNGQKFNDLLRLRMPQATGEPYWSRLRKAVNALCRKRYYRNCAEDRRDIAMNIMTNHVCAICLHQIEHEVRNMVQSEMHDHLIFEYAIQETWKKVAKALGITEGVCQTLRADDGSSFGPTLREAVLYYCAMDAAAGIRPISGFACLDKADYDYLNSIVDYTQSNMGDKSA